MFRSIPSSRSRISARAVELTSKQWSGSRSKSPRCTWVLRPHSDNWPDGAEYSGCPGRVYRPTTICEEANQCFPGRCRRGCRQTRCDMDIPYTTTISRLTLVYRNALVSGNSRCHCRLPCSASRSVRGAGSGTLLPDGVQLVGFYA